MIKRTLVAALVALSLTSAVRVFADAPATQPDAKPYPFTKCMISGEKLGGDMGDPVVIDYKGQQVKFCCHSCEAKFKKNPDKYMKEMADAENMPTTAPSN